MNDDEQEINEPQKADKSEEQYESPEIMNFIQENKENKTDDEDIRSDHESKQSKKNMNSDEEDDNAPIGLGNRQLSFNDLSNGHVIPEGLGEDDIDFKTIDQNPAESVLVLTKNEEVNDTIIGLNARQDSASNFNIISNIETAEKSENNFTDVDDNELLKRKNEERSKELGYNPNNDQALPGNNTQQNFSSSQSSDSKMSMSKNSSSAEFFATSLPFDPLIPIERQKIAAIDERTADNKVERSTSAGNDFKNQDIKNKISLKEEEEELSSYISCNSEKNDINNASKKSDSSKKSPIKTPSNIISPKNKNDAKPDEKKPIEASTKKSLPRKTTVQNDIKKSEIRKSKSNSKFNKKSLNNDQKNIKSFLPNTSSNTETGVLPKDFYLDLQGLGRNGQINIDSGGDSSRIPPKLLEIIMNQYPPIPKDSLVYIALCGVEIIGYKQVKVHNALRTLRKIENQCIDKGYVMESAYVDEIIESNLKALKELKILENIPSPAEISNYLDSAKNEYDSAMHDWNSKQAEIQTELEIALTDMKLRFQNEKKELDNKWQSELVVIKYNKPSSKLIEMRYVAKQMMKIHRFDEVPQMVKSMKKYEENESNEASYRMKSSYDVALSRLKKKYEIEEKTIRSTYEKKRNQAEREAKVGMVPIIQKVSRFTNQKESLEESLKRNPIKSTKRTTSSKLSSRIPRDLVIGANTKLKLNPVITGIPSSRKRSRLTSSEASSRTSSNNWKRIPRPTSQLRNRSSESSMKPINID